MPAFLPSRIKQRARFISRLPPFPILFFDRAQQRENGLFSYFIALGIPDIDVDELLDYLAR